MFNRKSSVVAAFVIVGSLGAGAAQAGEVQWSVGINLPAVATVVSNEPVHHRAVPVYYAPPPVYVEPAPRVVYRPVPVVAYPSPPAYVPYRPEPAIRAVWAAPVLMRDGPRHHHHHDHWHGSRHGHHDEYGERSRGGRWDAEPRGHRH